MAAYSYKALDAAGKISKGVLEGDSERHVRSQLRSRQLQPLEVQAASSVDTRSWFNAGATRRLPAEQVVLALRQLAVLVQSGVPLEEALGATARHSPHEGARKLLMQVRARVLSGQSFAASLAAFPQDFPRMYLAMVRAGEHAGLLGEVLDALADHGERRLALQRKLRMALIYPLALLVVATAVVALLLIFVMPQLLTLFDQSDAALPLLTRLLLGLSGFLAYWGWALVLLLVVVLAALRRRLRQGPVPWLDRLLLRLPLCGALLRESDASRFASTLAILVKSGVNLVEAIHIAAGVMGNTVLAGQAAGIAASVEEGGSLARALEATQLVSPLLLQLVASGESSGTLDAMLLRASAQQEAALADRLDALVRLMEPLVIVLMALIVGAIVLAVLLPILQMNSLIA